ncbi:MAG: hypothetical protein H8E31_06270 [Planctomycetes bacterium]|nr:hypothetical protein [Planctomycetota bacterium]
MTPLRIALPLLLLAAALAAPSCSSPLPRRDTSGEAFPEVQGESLAGEAVQLPQAVAGRPAVLLLGYVQDAQFDADRWLFGLLQAETPVQILELPTIPGLFPRLLRGTIDDGMRSGIPSEDWASVVTVYGPDAATLKAFTGVETPRNIRVLMLDRDGRVVWMHDRGFSAGKMLELDRAARALAGDGGGS